MRMLDGRDLCAGAASSWLATGDAAGAQGTLVSSKNITISIVELCQIAASIVRTMFDETQSEFNRTPVDTCKIFTEHDSS